MRDKEFRREIRKEISREFWRGSDKVISAKTNPIRWVLLHYFIGLNVMVLCYFFWESIVPVSLPPAIFKWITFFLPAAVSVIHLFFQRRRTA